MMNLGKAIPLKAVYFKITFYNIIDVLCHLQQVKDHCHLFYLLAPELVFRDLVVSFYLIVTATRKIQRK